MEPSTLYLKRGEEHTLNKTYYVILFGRNGGKSIRMVIDSLLFQTVAPEKIYIIDDGSTDGMYETCIEYENRFPNLIWVRETASKTSDFSRLPLLWNMGITRQYDFHVILPSDAALVPDYAERILAEFEKDEKLVVCSGDWGPKKSVSPHGGGRFVRQTFFEKYYPKGYPHILGYESEILERATLEGYHIKVLNDVEIIHRDKLGHSHNFSEFGYGMRCLGYYPPYALARCVWDFFNNPTVGKVGAIKMFRYYIFFRPAKTGYYSKFPADIRKKVSERQKKMLFGHLKFNLFDTAKRSANMIGIKNTGIMDYLVKKYT